MGGEGSSLSPPLQQKQSSLIGDELKKGFLSHSGWEILFLIGFG